jgi:uncharacterized protein (DUF433 family)
MMNEIFAFSIDRASRLSGLSVSRLRRWDQIGLYSPEFADEDRSRSYSRIYSFRDIVGLRTLAQLRARVPLGELRKLGEWLQRHYDAPWSSLRFYLMGRKVLVADPDSGLKITIRPPGQQPLPAFEMEEIARDTRRAIEQLQERQPENIGRITRHRHVLSNVPVIAGTRIPTSAIWDYHEAGYDISAILREYPQLTSDDVEAAIAEESQHRQKAS